METTQLHPRDRMIVSIRNITTAKEALPYLGQLDGSIGVLAIGLELFLSEGPLFLRNSAKFSGGYMLDLNLHDSPDRVYRTVKIAARHVEVSFITVHAAGGIRMMSEAVRAANDVEKETGHRVKILAVSAPPSVGANELKETGVAISEFGFEAVLWGRIELAIRAGCHGAIVPAKIARVVHTIAFVQGRGMEFSIVTPEVSFSGMGESPNLWSATAERAMRNYADYVVIGAEELHKAMDIPARIGEFAGQIERGIALREVKENDHVKRTGTG